MVNTGGGYKIYHNSYAEHESGCQCRDRHQCAINVAAAVRRRRSTFATIYLRASDLGTRYGVIVGTSTNVFSAIDTTTTSLRT